MVHDREHESMHHALLANVDTTAVGGGLTEISSATDVDPRPSFTTPMYWYLSFLRPPPVSVPISQGSITITPQIANDLRTEYV